MSEKKFDFRTAQLTEEPKKDGTVEQKLIYTVDGVRTWFKKKIAPLDERIEDELEAFRKYLEFRRSLLDENEEAIKDVEYTEVKGKRKLPPKKNHVKELVARKNAKLAKQKGRKKSKAQIEKEVKALNEAAGKTMPTPITKEEDK